MSKIAIITDLHFGVRNNSTFFLQNQKDFIYGTFFPYLESNGIKDVWILGDLLENRKFVNVQILNELNDFCKRLESADINVVCLIGNHDIYYKNTNTVNSLVPTTSAFRNIKLINTFEVINFDGLDVGFISWISPEIREQAIQWLKTVDAKIICGHFEINSFEIIKGVVCSKGLEPDLFERFDKVFSGHFHIRSTNGLIQYIGNPYQTNWGEYGFAKGFAIFNTADQSLQFVDNPVSVYSIFTYSDNLKVNDFDASPFSSKIVRVLVGECKNKKKLEVFLDAINAVAYLVEIIEDKEVVINGDGDETIPSDTIQLINQFLDSCKIEHLDRSHLDKAILEIYSEAIERGVVEC